MKKRIIASLLTAAMTASLLAGCGGSDSSAPAASDSQAGGQEAGNAPWH